MSGDQLSVNQDAVAAASRKTRGWREQAPFLLVLALSLAGVAYSNVSQEPLAFYWELLALVTGGVCVFNEWGKIDERQARVRLIFTQAAHWVAVLVAMNIMLLAGVQQLLSAPATSLVLLMLLALGSFLAGVSLVSLELCFLGLILALAVPALSWIKHSMLIVVLAAVFIVGIGMVLWSNKKA